MSVIWFSSYSHNIRFPPSRAAALIYLYTVPDNSSVFLAFSWLIVASRVTLQMTIFFAQDRSLLLPPPPSLLFCFSQICIEYYVDTNTTSARKKEESLIIAIY